MKVKVVEKKVEPDTGKGSDGAYYVLVLEGGRRLVVSRKAWDLVQVGWSVSVTVSVTEFSQDG
jgi:hypothetical protein